MNEQRREKGSSITRVLEIIEAISLTERPFSATELSFLLDIPKPSIHRLLQQLEASNYIQTNMRGQLVPGDRMHDIALGVLQSSRHKAARQAILKNLASKIGETCGISIFDGTDMIYYDKIETNWPLRIHLPTGSHTPIACTASGKLYLSTLPEDRLNRILQNLPLDRLARNTITDPATLTQAIADISQTQIGTDNEEFIDGMVACSIPIENKTGSLFACLFAHAPIIRKSLPELLAFEPLMRKAAIELSDLISKNSSPEY
ncbi:IclR family transcriptional regulator [Neptunomonas sp.]|uniref:IclR family transcriptional regulator n=1 Tax=Neptunomonas sp. TaxID=1971898 RepID=UPI0035669740